MSFVEFFAIWPGDKYLNVYVKHTHMYDKRTILSVPEEKVLEQFLDLKKHYFAEISNKTKLTRPRTLSVLKSMVEAGVLSTEKEANIKYYHINKNPSSYVLLGVVEYNRTHVFLEQNKVLKRALSTFSEKCSDYLIIIVFGSYVKNYAVSSSDIDLLLIKENITKKDVKTAEELADIVNGRTGMNISPYLMKTEEFRKGNDLTEEVHKNHILIEGAELFFRLLIE